MSLINIATFNNATEAYLLKAKLESEGIPAFVFGISLKISLF